jgi:uncharacterized membrane protein
MTRREAIVAWALALVVFLALDAAWLSSMADRLYRPALGALLAPSPSWSAALLFYAMYAGGIVGFAVAPVLGRQGWRASLVRGAALGLLAYGSYDLTNQATLRGCLGLVMLRDLAGGVGATALAAGATTLLLRARRH